MKLMKFSSVVCMTYVCGLLVAANTFAQVVPLTRTEAAVSKSAVSLPGATYTWVAMPDEKAVQKDARVQDLQLRARLVAALDKALQAKGYRLAQNPSTADFIVAFGIGVQDVHEVTLKGDQGATPLSVLACDWDSCSQLVVMNDSKPNMRVVTTDRVEGGLMVEVIEPRTVRVLWRALNKGAVKRGDGSQKTLDTIAAHTLARLPENN